MKIVLQRVQKSSVTIDGKVNGEVQQGYMALVGFCNGDNQAIVDKMIDKMIGLRVFEDDQGKMNLSLQDIQGSILSISQFTLYADCTQGNRPGFTNAAQPEYANELYEYFCNKCTENEINVQKGIFGADMKVSLLNDGPVTIILEK